MQSRGIAAPSPPPATASAEGAQLNGRPFPATASAEGAQFNVPPFPATASAEGRLIKGGPFPARGEGQNASPAKLVLCHVETIG
jgi:hypothetical protein